MNEQSTISKATIVRTVALLLALINQALLTSGHSILPIADADIEMLVSAGFTVVTALAAWWKNNSFTKAALIGDRAMEEAKRQ